MATVVPRASTLNRFINGSALNGVLWTGQVLVGVLFAGSGFGKILLIDNDLYAEAPDAVSWYAAVPQSLIVFIGVCELLGGLGLLLPATSRVKPSLVVLAAAGLATTMVLATGFHLIREELGLACVTLVLGGVAAGLAVGRRHRPISAQPLALARVILTIGVLLAIVVLVLIPTWYTTTHSDF